MIITEQIKIGDKDFIKTYSDKNFYIKKVGTEETYDVAFDPIEFKDVRKYEETDIPVPAETEQDETPHKQAES